LSACQVSMIQAVISRAHLSKSYHIYDFTKSTDLYPCLQLEVVQLLRNRWERGFDCSQLKFRRLGTWHRSG